MGGEVGISGGCQCGAVRYRASMQPVSVHYCHCRMCQRAVGNVFATLCPVKKSSLTWNGTPGFFNSSTKASRGFCRECGTPLSFAYNDSEWICVTLGSVDDPASVPPTIHYGIESQVPWLHLDDGLPREPTEEIGPPLDGLVSHQAPLF